MILLIQDYGTSYAKTIEKHFLALRFPGEVQSIHETSRRQSQSREGSIVRLLGHDGLVLIGKPGMSENVVERDSSIGVVFQHRDQELLDFAANLDV